MPIVRAVIFAAATIAIALPARASDASSSGVYFGLNAGAVGAAARVTPVTPGSGSFTVGMGGGAAGAMAGFLVQTGPVSLGIEAEMSSLNVSGDETTQVGGSRTRTEMEISRNARIRGRLGAGVGRRWFFYGAAGWTQVATKMTLTSLSAPGQTSSASETLNGFTIGGGAEFAFTPRLIGRVEYLFDSYDGATYKTGNGFFVNRRVDDMYTGTLRAAMSFKF